jgi:nucleoside-diphosphate-sugar epimerase
MLARQLVEAGADVSVFHRGKSDNPVLPDSVTHIRDPSAEYPIVRFPDSVTKTDWDAVIHMVVMGALDGRAAKAFAGRAGRLLMISSADVYRAYGRLTGLEPGEPDAVPLTEDAALRRVFYPYRKQAARLGAYANDYEKNLAEREVAAVTDLPSVILRLPKVYGREDNGNLATVYWLCSRAAMALDARPCRKRRARNRAGCDAQIRDRAHIQCRRGKPLRRWPRDWPPCPLGR